MNMVLSSSEVALMHGVLQTTHENLRGSVVTRLDIGVDLMTIESSTPEVN